MTIQDLGYSLKALGANYNRDVDDNLIKLWFSILHNFNHKFLQLACVEIIKNNKFFPNASELIDVYQRIKIETDKKRIAEQKEKHKQLVDNQAYCYLCDNNGWCIFPDPEDENYDLAARCTCLHGKDLNKFSKMQIGEAYDDDNPFTIKTKHYMRTVKEVLGDDFAIFEARKKEKYLSRQPVSNKEKLEILKKLKNIGA